MRESRHETIIVELPPEPECPACGCRGAHFCVGTRNYKSVAYIGVRRPMYWKSKEGEDG